MLLALPPSPATAERPSDGAHAPFIIHGVVLMARAAMSEGESLLLGGSIAPRVSGGGGGGGGDTPARSAPPPAAKNASSLPSLAAHRVKKRKRKTIPSCNQLSPSNTKT